MSTRLGRPEGRPRWADPYLSDGQRATLAEHLSWMVVLEGGKDGTPKYEASVRQVAARLLITTMGRKEWDRRSFRSASTLATMTGLSRQTVIRATQVLERDGWLDVERGGGRRAGGYAANTYWLAWPDTDPHLDAPDGPERCLAPLVSKRSGKVVGICQRRAGWGVEGTDSGPCKLHVPTPAEGQPSNQTTVSRPTVGQSTVQPMAGSGPTVGHEYVGSSSSHSESHAAAVVEDARTFLSSLPDFGEAFMDEAKARLGEQATNETLICEAAGLARRHGVSRQSGQVREAAVA